MIRALALALSLIAAPAAAQQSIIGGHPCGPALILSHGFGGSSNGLSDLAAAAVFGGWNVWLLDHPESGRDALRDVLAAPDRRAALARAVADPALNAARARDLDHLLATALPRCAALITVFGGHSMGAQTAIIEAGAANGMGVTGSDRFDAYIALSPQGRGERFKPGAWAGIDKPVLMITGTRDTAIEGDYRTRLSAFEGLPAEGTKWLAIIDGGTHRHMSGRGDDPEAVLVREIVLDFLTGLVNGGVDLKSRPGVEIRHR
ncbi:hypothetical protein [Oceanicola sp. 22II-s10i]|uniref:hypothetical protein n=1 Tax=Oceanicola sp. 22II-s10i TaxID=1317116 RepID=UPI000B52434C|nr:hypothetical protein [Oceanicola sp. 22II-s10i]